MVVETASVCWNSIRCSNKTSCNEIKKITEKMSLKWWCYTEEEKTIEFFLHRLSLLILLKMKQSERKKYVFLLFIYRTDLFTRFMRNISAWAHCQQQQQPMHTLRHSPLPSPPLSRFEWVFLKKSLCSWWRLACVSAVYSSVGLRWRFVIQLWKTMAH